MPLFVCFLVISLFSNLGHANDPKLAHQVKFQSTKNLDSNLTNASASSVLIYLYSKDDEPVGRCTGTFISKTGLLLTARHCILESCLADYLKEASSEKKFSGYADYPSDDFFKGKKCRIGINEFEIESADIVVLGGKGILDVGSPFGQFFQTNLVRKNKAGYKELADQGFFQGGDFVVLKTSPNRVKACAPLAKEEVKINQSVSLLSFPRETSRAGEGNSDGEHQYLSTGVVTEKLTICSSKPLLPWYREGLELVLSESYLIPSTVDAVMRSSGAALFNSMGEVLGVLISGFSNHLEECPGGEISVSIKHIFKMIEKQLDEDSKSAIAACKQEKQI